MSNTLNWTRPSFDHSPPAKGDGFYLRESKVSMNRNQFDRDTEMKFEFSIIIEDGATPSILSMIRVVGRFVAQYISRMYGVSEPSPETLDGLFMSPEEEKKLEKIDHSYKVKRKLSFGEDE